MTSENPVDTHDPAGMAAFLRARAQASREFLKLTDEQQIRQFLESWQKNVLPHFAFRFDQAATMIEGLSAKLERIERLAAGNITGCGTCSTILEEFSNTRSGEHR